MSPELAEALRNEIRTALEAGGGPFDINVARRVYDLAIAARDMCIAATGSVKEAIDQIKETNGPMETLDSSDTPESQVQVSESFGARLLRELMATLPMLQGPRGEDPKQLVHALAEARRNGMHDVAEQIEVKLFGRVLSGLRPISAEEIDVTEGSYEQGYADGRAGALPVSQESAYHEGYLKGTEAKYLDKGPLPVVEGAGTGDHSAAIARDVHLGRTSQEIRDEIIAKVGMMADARTPEMQARYDAGVERERTNGASVVVNEPCNHPTEALFDAPYDDGYQVFCHACGKHVRFGRQPCPQPASDQGAMDSDVCEEREIGHPFTAYPSAETERGTHLRDVCSTCGDYHDDRRERRPGVLADRATAGVQT